MMDNDTLRLSSGFATDADGSLLNRIVARAEKCYNIRHRTFSATLLIGLLIWRDHPVMVIAAATAAMGLSVLLTTIFASALTFTIGVASSLLSICIIVCGFIGSYLWWDSGLWLWVAVVALQGWFSLGSSILAFGGKLTLGFLVEFVAPIDLRKHITHPPTYFLIAAVKNNEMHQSRCGNQG